MPTTYHLIPVGLWTSSDPSKALRRASLDDEGFIHCTNGADALIETANRHYLDDPSDFLALTVELDRVTSSWRYDDPDKPYPHIYGPIDRAAIASSAEVRRDGDGVFLSIGPNRPA